MYPSTRQATAAYRPERWLIRSSFVFDAIWSRAGKGNTLAALRLDAGLVELVKSDYDLRIRMPAIEDGAPGTMVHLVFERVDRAAAELAMELGRRYPNAQLHDFSQSSSEILLSLAAPDEAIVEQLLARARGHSFTVLRLPAVAPAQGPSTSGVKLAGRLQRALAHWERTAREFHGEDFDDQYADGPVPWDRMLVDPIDVPGLDSGPVVHVTRFLAPIASLAHARGGVARVAEGSQKIEWGPLLVAAPGTDGRLAATSEVMVTASRPSDGTMQVLVETEWGGGFTCPESMRLCFEGPHEFVLVLMTEDDEWDPGGDGVHRCRRAVDDPSGDLWTQLCSLDTLQVPKALQLDRKVP